MEWFNTLQWYHVVVPFGTFLVMLLAITAIRNKQRFSLLGFGGEGDRWFGKNAVGILGVIGATIALVLWPLSGWNPGPSLVMVGIGVFLYGGYKLFTEGSATWKQALVGTLILVPFGVLIWSSWGQDTIVTPVRNFLNNKAGEQAVDEAPTRNYFPQGETIVVPVGTEVTKTMLAGVTYRFSIVGTGGGGNICLLSPQHMNLAVNASGDVARIQLLNGVPSMEVTVKAVRGGTSVCPAYNSLKKRDPNVAYMD